MSAHIAMIQPSTLAFLILAWAISSGPLSITEAAEPQVKSFQVKGTVREIKPDGKTVVIDHQRIPNYMDAMTMPFRVKATNELTGLHPGDVVSFRLSVTDSESWVDRISRVASSTNATAGEPLKTAQPGSPPAVNVLDGLAAYTFLNEFGRPINFRDYRGQAIALTFFFTRCPIPDYCPRLTRNFLAATRKMAALANAPANWHLFSISFDPADTPELLHSYAKGYGYDSNRWTFLTASPQTISAVARNFGFKFKNEGGSFSHEFLTVVLDAKGYWQAGWPIGGDTSDMLVEQLIKAAATNVVQQSNR